MRQVLGTALGALTAAVVARALGVSRFGTFAGGTAAFYLALALTDLGFAVVLAREMAQNPGREGRLLRATVHVQLLWSAVIATGLAGLGLVSGGTRGAVMLVLSPAVLVGGLSSSRQIFTVRYRARPLLVLDLATSLAQAAALITLAALGMGPVELALVMVFTAAVNTLASAALARRVIDDERPRAGDRRRMLRLALPVGIASVLASLYFTVDMVLLGWLVSSRQLGHYAAAVRFLTAIVALPGLLVGAGIPGLARAAGDREQLSRFAGTLAHWLTVTVLPLCVGLAVFARPAVRLVFGSAYTDSIALLRVLMLAAVLCLASNVIGAVLISVSIMRTNVLVNVLSLAVNVTGNIILAPRYGVIASAWLTVASEAIVIAYGLGALRHRLSYRLIGARVWRGALACALAGGLALTLGPSRAYALPAGLAGLAAALLALRALPGELTPARLRRFAGPEPAG